MVCFLLKPTKNIEIYNNPGELGLIRLTKTTPVPSPSSSWNLCFTLKPLQSQPLNLNILGSVKMCFMHPVWKVSVWVLTNIGSVSGPVRGAGLGVAFSCWDLRPLGLEGVWLGSTGQAGQDRTKGIWVQNYVGGAGTPHLSSYWPCAIAFNLENEYLSISVNNNKLHHDYAKTGSDRILGLWILY